MENPIEYLFDNLLNLSDLVLQDDIKLKYINRTNSNTSCNSDSTSTSSGIESGYLSSNDSIYSLIPHSPDSSPTITYGYFGKAKTNNPTDTSNQIKHVKSNNDFSLIDSINHGDDCGFVLNKKVILKNDTEENIFFLGLADGVSANRVRGYDAKLFPSALLDNCAQFLANNQTKEVDDESISQDFIKNNSFLFENDESSVDYEEENEFYDDIQEQNLDDIEDVFNDYYVNTDNEFDMNNNDFMHNQNLNETFRKYSLINNDCKFLYKTLLSSHNKVIEQNVYGSSTACLLSLKFVDLNQDKINTSTSFINQEDNFNWARTALLSSCNLGDSGYMIIRNKNVIFKSSTQTHRFNAPYQLGCTPPELLDHDLYRDKADDSLCQTHEIKSGDFILLSSDGLFDNLYEDEIALIIDNHIQSSINSSSLTSLSCDLSNDTNKKTVFYSQNLITSELLSSACEVLVQKAANAGIKRDDMLIILVYVN